MNNDNNLNYDNHVLIIRASNNDIPPKYFRKQWLKANIKSPTKIPPKRKSSLNRQGPYDSP